ncbi:MAG TPA: TetR/AcrR family transcriptional regulator [Amycolatopsis sp.]|nr:TetR/AcrR family transcriptional regulator [Amycolatopsis sp.]
MDNVTDQAPDESAAAETRLGPRATRTRNAILLASKQLFLTMGYAGTRINNITDACGISRAGFYTYFRDKREIFDALGAETYHELLKLASGLDNLPRPCSRADLGRWVRQYFDFLDEHGAFILSTKSAPGDDDVKTATNRMQMRVSFVLGASLRSRQKHPTTTPEALGLTAQAMLERSWYYCRPQQLPVDADDVIEVVTGFLVSMLEAEPRQR